MNGEGPLPARRGRYATLLALLLLTTTSSVFLGCGGAEEAAAPAGDASAAPAKPVPVDKSAGLPKGTVIVPPTDPSKK